MRGPKTFFPPLHVLNAQDIKKGFACALSMQTKKHQLGNNRKTRILIHKTLKANIYKWKKKQNNNKLYDIYNPDEVKIFFECMQDVCTWSRLVSGWK